MVTRLTIVLIAIVTSVLSTSAFSAVGRTSGQFAVSPIGSAQYSIPLWTPAGIGALQKKLALSYDSQRGNGLLGMGWGVAGLSSIYRCNLTFAQDGVAGSPQLVTTDRLCLDGKRLRLTSSENLTTYGQGGTTYQTEIAEFSNITANGTAGNGASYFTVQGKDGLTYEYGNTTDSKILAGGGAVASVRTWALDKITDRSGNSIHYVYVNDTTNFTYRISDIYYPYSSSNGQGPLYDVHFTYAARPTADTLTQYVVGYPATETQLLSEIDVQHQNGGWQLAKKYVLTYGSGTSNRSQLKQIQECSATDCLLPTAITYQNATAGVGTEVSTGQTVTTFAGAQMIDIDGDGIDDLVYPNSSTNTYWVMLGSANGLGSPTNTGASSANYASALPIDFNSDGKMDLLIPNSSGNWRILQSTGTAFTVIDTSIPATGAGGNAWVGDVDGDGRPDLIFVPNPTQLGGTIMVRYNTGTTFSNPATQVYQLGSSYAFNETGGTFGGAQQIYASSIALADFDGDGRVDLAVKFGFQNGTKWVHLESVLLSRGTSYIADAHISNLVHSGLPLIGDFNGDGYADYVYSPGVGNFHIAYGTGEGLSAPVDTGIASSFSAMVMDWDGDGRSDLLYQQAVGSTFNWYVALSTGAGFAAGVNTGIVASTTTPYIADITGDGLADWVYPDSSNVIKVRLHNGVTGDLADSFLDGYGNSAKPAYIAIPQSYTPNGDPSVPNPTTYMTVSLEAASYPYMNYAGPLQVVSQVAYSDPSSATGGTYTQTHYYATAWQNLQGRGFSGFREHNYDDSRTGWRLYAGARQDFPYTGMPTGPEFTDPNGNPVFQRDHTTAVTVLDSTTNNQRYFPYWSDVFDTYREIQPNTLGPITTRDVAYAYDNFGNATNITTTLTDAQATSPYYNQQWTTTRVTTVSADTGANWCLNMPTEVDTTTAASGVPNIVRHVSYTPDYANCREGQQVVEPSSSLYKVTTVYGFDSFGNISSQTVTGANMPASPASRLTTMNWGSTGQFVNTATDQSGATTTFNYSSSQALTFGLPDSVKDPNNLTTSWMYDSFGRKSKETRPDATSATWTWSICSSFCGWSNSVYQIAQTAYQSNGTTVIRTDTASFDPIDRVTQAAGPNVTGATATTQKLYNSLGLLAQESMPFLSGSPFFQSYSYDVLNRLIETERPVNASSGQTYCNPATVPPASGCQGTSYAYAGRTLTITDPRGYTKTTVTDVNGWLRKTTDALGYYVTNSYDAAGSRIGTVDSAGNSLLKNVTYAYGIKPFLLAATDADLGAWSYTIDSLGERTLWTDAKNQSFSMTYDALSRPLTRTEPDLFTQWTWGSTPASFNVGQLISECTQSSSPCSSTNALYYESRAFDSVGRPSTRSILETGDSGNDGGGAFLFTSTYGPTGQISSLAYPKTPSGFSLHVQYGYQYGLLNTVTDASDPLSVCGSSCTLWTANTANAFGQITQETLGNRVVTNRSYDSVTSWLSRATAGVGGGAALVNQSYLQDKNGSITQRQNNNLGLTESFGYDADNRLTCTALSATCSTATLAYDGGVAGPGNITSQTGVGTYTYPAAGQPRPHAVTSITGTFNGITNPSFSYDANGNMTNRASSSPNITWSSYNYPTDIAGTDATGSEEVQFNYGPDRQRWKQTYTGPSGIETTYYIGGLFEMVFVGGVTNYRHYIYAGGEPVAVYNRNVGSNVMHYMIEDHQGGVSSIASAAGVTLVNESFSAFGTLRNSSTWSGAPTTNDLTFSKYTRQGYTFQTALGQSMGLNHMNGRVQDAILGRFLSPDSHIPDPTNAQSYSRYSYVNNNPLTLIDPTGFSSAIKTQNEKTLGDIMWEMATAGQEWSSSPGPAAFGQAAVGGSSGDGSSPTNPIDAFNKWAGGWISSKSDSQSSSTQSQGESVGTVWADANGGNTDATMGLSVTAKATSRSDLEVASTGLDLLGAGWAGIEARYGEHFLGSNGRLYSRLWANGVGRSYPIKVLTKVGGIYLLVAGTVFDAQSLQDGNITNVEFGTNLGAGALMILAPFFAVGGINMALINAYPGGWEGYREDFFLHPDVLGNPLLGGYDGLH